MLKNRKGFTIVELVIVIAVIAILAAVLIPSFSSLNKKAKDSAYLQERTNQQIADLAEKVENQKFLSWEDLEAKLAEELAQIDSGASTEDVEDAIAKAIAKFENSLKTDDTALTEAQVKAIVEKALEGQLTTAQVEGIVKEAVSEINKNPATPTITEAQIKAIIDNAVAGLDKQTGITAEEMETAITNAIKGQTNLDADDVAAEINKALAGFGYGNDLSASQIENIINNAMVSSKLKADDLAAEEMTAIIANTGDNFEAAVTALSNAGYNVGALKPIRTGYVFCWTANEIKCVKAEDKGTMKEILGEGASFINVKTSTSEEAAEALKYGCDLTLEGAVELEDTVEIKNDAVIDLNGFNIDASANNERPFKMADGSTLTINAEGSTINCGLYGLVNIPAGNDATIVINGGTFLADTDNGAFIKLRSGTGTINITLNNVTVIDESDDGFIMNAQGFGGTLNLTINGGSFKANAGIEAKGLFNINGATFETAGCGITAYKEANISNCTFITGNKTINSTPAIAIYASSADANVTVKDCTITAGVHHFGVWQGGSIVATNVTVLGDSVEFTPNTGTITIN